MANHLIHENSPYLQQHVDNPVDWYPWNEDALQLARTQDKPIFLSIGYAACHWCHVMAHESFEDPDTARLLNENFINIKVDREERPDLDSVYMNAVVSMTGQGGWPMSVFLTPDGKPFFGGTYYPPVRRYNMPSFTEVILAIKRAWKDERDQLIQSARDLTQHLINANSHPGGRQVLSVKNLDDAAFRLAQSYDWEHGGWGKAPKFPQPMAIEYLVTRASFGDQLAAQIVEHCLSAMAKGGMYDLIGGGFARYSTDDHWLVPHFEKMLYDNAQLARIYLHAYMVTKNQYYRRICEETLDFIAREMMTHNSDDATGSVGFFSSVDADSEGVEGKYYVWSMDEIQQALLPKTVSDEGETLDLKIFLAAFGITSVGNFEGKTVLQRAVTDEDLSTEFGMTQDQINHRLDRNLKRLFEVRQVRVRPITDDKVLAVWNALTLIAFSEAARYLNRPDYLEIAKCNADFLLGELYKDGKLLRSWRQGRAQHHAYLEDYAALILALLSLYQSNPQPRWFEWADRLTNEMIIYFKDQTGGFYDTSSDQENLILRPKDLQDNATPCGNSLAVLALLQLSMYTGDGELRDLAEEMLGGIQDVATKYPTAFAQWLSAIDFAVFPVKEVVILGDPIEKKTQILIAELWKDYRPRLISAISDFPPAVSYPPLLLDRELLDHLPTAYVCQNMVCLKPVNSTEEFAKLLNLSFDI